MQGFTGPALFLLKLPMGTTSIAVRNPAGCVTIGAIFEVSCPCTNPPVVLLSSTSGSTCGTMPVTVAGNTFGGSGYLSHDNRKRIRVCNSGICQPHHHFHLLILLYRQTGGRTVIITVTSNNPLGVPCNTAIATYTLTVNANPAPPSVGTITNPTCTSDRGSIVLNDLPSTGQMDSDKASG